MRREDVLARLRETEPALRARGVLSLYLFGSHARDEADAGSDIDVFVDPIADDGFGFLQFMDAYETIRSAFGGRAEVGYSTREGLSPYIRTEVERRAIRVF